MNVEAEDRPLSRLEYKFHFVPWFWEPDYRTDPTNITIPDELNTYFDILEPVIGTHLDTEQRAWYVAKAMDTGVKMKQEYPSTPEEAFERLLEGAFYGEEMMKLRQDKRLTMVPYEPSLPVNTGWDLGMRGSTRAAGGDFCIVFHQRHGFQNRIFDFYKNSGLGLRHYINVLREKDYTYGTHYLPHDIKVRELGNEVRAKTRLERLQEMAPSENWVVVPMIENEADGTEAVRNFIPTCWIDKENCAHLVKALDSYRREFDDKIGTFRPVALHDWASDPEAAIRSIACGYQVEVADNWKPKRAIRARRA